MKNIIVGVLTLIIFAIAIWVASLGGAYNGGEHGKVIADIGNRVANVKSTKIEEKDDRAKENDELTALRNKAGSISAFDVSDDYDRKCSSCHGINGSGFQNGKKMMGPKLFGQSADELFKKLSDFKAGRKENVVMKGLLIPLSEDDLRVLADEIGDFPARAKANQKK
jgi:cytochrome c553